MSFEYTIETSQDKPVLDPTQLQEEDHTSINYDTLTQQEIQQNNAGKDNYPFGDILQKKEKNTIRLFFRNINGIFKANSWTPLHTSCQQLITAEVDIVGFAETNIKWDIRRHNQTSQAFKRVYKQCTISTASGSKTCVLAYQPGGTVTVATGKYTGRITKNIKDTNSMGRWTGLRFATNYDHFINVVTVYQSVKADGIHTSYRQQMHALHIQVSQSTNPRKSLLTDLANEIIQWNANGDTTIIMMDANDSLFNKDSLLPTFLSKTALISMVPNPEDHPATHLRGSKCIDFIFGSINLVQHIKYAGITAFLRIHGAALIIEVYLLI
jgi:hypothetical protein